MFKKSLIGISLIFLVMALINGCCCNLSKIAENFRMPEESEYSVKNALIVKNTSIEKVKNAIYGTKDNKGHSNRDGIYVNGMKMAFDNGNETKIHHRNDKINILIKLTDQQENVAITFMEKSGGSELNNFTSELRAKGFILE